jgi:hypothetical protein
MEILIVIIMTVVLCTVIMKVGEKDYKEGYTDCVKHYLDTKILIPFEEPKDSYERAWNDACEELSKE